MKAFVNKLRGSSDSLTTNEEFFEERKQLNSLYTYYSHSLLYLERLDGAIKDLNIMINDLNSCLMTYFESDVNREIIKQISLTLKSFNSVRDQLCNQIIQSKNVVNSHLNKINDVKMLCLKNKQLGDSIKHYEKKIQKLESVSQPSQKHLEKNIRNKNKLNKVKSDYITCSDRIKIGISSILENKMNKVLFDAKRNLELMLYYFSLMNSCAMKLREPLKVFEMPLCQHKGEKGTYPIEDNFFLEQTDRMNYFYEKKESTNPFSNEGNEDMLCKFNSKITNKLINFKTFLKDGGKSPKQTNDAPYFPQ